MYLFNACILYYDIVLCAAAARVQCRARLHAFQWTVVISVCFDLTFSCSLCLLLSSPPPPFPSSYVHLLCRALGLSDYRCSLRSDVVLEYNNIPNIIYST